MLNRILLRYQNHDVNPESFLQNVCHTLMMFLDQHSSAFHRSVSDTASQPHRLSPVSKEAVNPWQVLETVKSMENQCFTMTTWPKDSITGRCNPANRDQPEINSFSPLSHFSSKPLRACERPIQRSHHVERRGIPSRCLFIINWGEACRQFEHYWSDH